MRACWPNDRAAADTSAGAERVCRLCAAAQLCHCMSWETDSKPLTAMMGFSALYKVHIMAVDRSGGAGRGIAHFSQMPVAEELYFAPRARQAYTKTVKMVCMGQM